MHTSLQVVLEFRTKLGFDGTTGRKKVDFGRPESAWFQEPVRVPKGWTGT